MDDIENFDYPLSAFKGFQFVHLERVNGDSGVCSPCKKGFNEDPSEIADTYKCFFCYMEVKKSNVDLLWDIRLFAQLDLLKTFNHVEPPV